jgi:hypothetical protein
LFIDANENRTSKLVDPNTRYINVIPKRRKQEIIPPNTKYLSPASVENSEFLLNVAKMYSTRLCSSIAR